MMAPEKKQTFLEWGKDKGITDEKAASIAEAASIKPESKITEKEYEDAVKKFGLTLAERLGNTKIPQDVWAGIAEAHQLKLDSLVSGPVFGQIHADWRKEQKKNDPPAPAAPEKPAKQKQYTPVGCTLKYLKTWLKPGDMSNLAELSAKERSVLLAQGKIKEV